MWKSNDFWIPEFKWQIVDWLVTNYPCGCNGDRINWDRYNKKQLLAIYIEKRKKYEQGQKTEKTREDKSNTGETKIRKPEQLEFQF